MNGDLQAQFDHFAAFVAAQFESYEARMLARFNALETQMRDGFRDVGDHLQRLDTWMTSLEARVEALERAVKALEGRLADGFLAISDRFAAQDARIDQLDAALAARVAEMEHRITSLWFQVRDRQASTETKTDALTLAVESLGKTVDLLRHRVEAVAEGTANLTGVMVERTNTLSKDVLSRLENVEKHLMRLGARVDGLSEEMLQRFRVVNERLGDIDRRLAA